MRNRTYGGVRGRKMKVGGKLLHFPPTRLLICGYCCPLKLKHPSKTYPQCREKGVAAYFSKK